MSFIDIFNDSYERVVGRGIRLTSKSEDFFEDFYTRFMASSDEVAKAFANTDMARQRSMLKKSLLLLVSFFAGHEASPYLEHIARLHGAGRVDVPARLYEVWLECLIDSVHAFDPKFDDDVELSWRLVLGHGITYMKFMHNRGESDGN